MIRLNPIGLIPAGAGKTRSRFRQRWTRPAHPRWCGENILASRLAVGMMGSSPLVRGKRNGGTTTAFVKGLIPAGAGKTTRHAVPLAVA